MEKKYDIKISCGKYFNPTLNNILMAGGKMDKEVHISGDVSLSDVQSIASRIAVSTYDEKLKAQREDPDLGFMPDGVANAFIFSNEELISAVSAFLEGKEPSFEIYDKEKLEQAMQPVDIDFPGFHR